MPVTHREDPVTLSRSAHSTSVEDVLRDAALFACSDEAPAGLAHRALANKIASQSSRERQNLERSSRKRSVALWFGGLSAGTLAGASAAILIMASLNRSVFHISPEAASLTASVMKQSETEVPEMSELAPAVTEQPRSRPQKMTIAQTSMVPTKKSVLQPRPSRTPPVAAEPKVPSRPIQVAALKEHRLTRMARAPRVTRQVSAPARVSTASPVVRWKTEAFEETEYQLVTAAYVASPKANTGDDGYERDSHVSGNYPSRIDHMPLTPVQMRSSHEQSVMDSIAMAPVSQF